MYKYLYYYYYNNLEGYFFYDALIYIQKIMEDSFVKDM